MTEDEAKQWLLARVSRETMERLELLNEMLIKWQRTINLVAPSTINSAWSRHFVDSAQLRVLAPPTAKSWLDIGSGGGFPSLVIAAMIAEDQPEFRMTMIESDIRKCGFMREAARSLGLSVNILSRRIADAPPQGADVISARALDGLGALLSHVSPHTKEGSCLLFPKGESFKAELEALPEGWQRQAEVLESVTDPAARIVRFTVPNEEEA